MLMRTSGTLFVTIFEIWKKCQIIWANPHFFERFFNFLNMCLNLFFLIFAYYISSWYFIHIPSNIIAFDQKIYDTLTMQVLIIPTDAPFRLSHRQLLHPVLANQYHSLNYFGFQLCRDWAPSRTITSRLISNHTED